MVWKLNICLSKAIQKLWPCDTCFKSYGLSNVFFFVLELRKTPAQTGSRKFLMYSDVQELVKYEKDRNRSYPVFDFKKSFSSILTRSDS